MKHQIDALLDKHGLTVESVFVPWSRSRNAGEKNPSLNWSVTLVHNGQKVLTTDYSAGCGHAPSYKQSFKRDYLNESKVLRECETGLKSQYAPLSDTVISNRSKPILPDPRDVIYSLLMDSEVLDYDGFESWADSFGYDQDSRRAEKMYQACMKIALQMNRLGSSVIEELREAYQDY